MNTNTESSLALPSYDVKDLVVFLPDDMDREIICKVVGHQRTAPELRYILKDSVSGDEYLATFRCLRPHVEFDPDDDLDCDPDGNSFEDDCASLSYAGGF